METEKKGKKFWKGLGVAALCYILISIVAGMCSVLRVSMQGDEGAKVSGFVVLEVVLMPVLFLIAGYVVSAKLKFGKIKFYKLFLGAVLFSGALFALWYVAMTGYVLCNLPAAEGSYALDLFLRKITVVIDYEVKYLKETNGYKYGLLPAIHFVFRVVYWLFYLWGNRMYCTKQKELERAQKKAKR